MDDSKFRGDSSGVGGSSAESTGLVSGQVRSDSGTGARRFCSIQYIDEEGDQVIRHAFLTVDEQKMVVDEFARRGMRGTVNDLTPPAVHLPGEGSEELG